MSGQPSPLTSPAATPKPVTFSGQADRERHVLELQPAQVAEQPRPALAALEEALADEQIEQAVAVVVEHRHAAAAKVRGQVPDAAETSVNLPPPSLRNR